MEQDYKGIADERVKRFLAFIKKHEKDQLRKIDEEGKKEEDYQVHKVKSQATYHDQENFKKLEDGVKVAEKIFKSRKINQCRMMEMKVRFDMIERVQEEAKNRLRKQAENPQEYRTLIKNLITQGLIKLVEEEVEIRCLRSDERLVSQVMSECQSEFNETCLVATTLKIDTANYLTHEDLGGVILTSFTGRIVCDNTLRARLSYCLQLLLPQIRGMLFLESDLELRSKRLQKKETQKKAKVAV